MGKRVVPGPKAEKDDACLLADDEDWAGDACGPWCLSEGLQGPFGGPFIHGGISVRCSTYVA